MLTIGSTYGTVCITNRFLTLLDLPEQLDEAIKNAIIEFEGSNEREMMTTGEMYYRTDNQKILNRKQYVYGECKDENGDDVYYKDEDLHKNYLLLSQVLVKLLLLNH